jgi:TonB family protein
LFCPFRKIAGDSVAFAHNLYKTAVHHIDMSFFLDTQETSQRFGNHISEFRSLLDTNHIRHGSPENLLEFTQILESNNRFRLEFASTIKAIAQREGDELLLTDMMSIMTSSIAGPSFPDTHLDITNPTNVLMEFLLSTGCWKQFGSPLSAKVLHTSSLPKSPIRIEQPSPTPPSDDSIVNEKPEDGIGLLDAASELRQILARLEDHAQKVNLHLDSIERRISEIKSPPATLPNQMPSSSESTPRPNPLHAEEADVASVRSETNLAENIPIFEQKLPTSSRAVFSLPSEQPEIDDFPSPTFSYASEKGKGIIPVGVFLVLLTVIVITLLFANSGPGRNLLKSGMSHLKAARAHFSSVPATAPQAPTTTQPPASVSPSTSTNVSPPTLTSTIPTTPPQIAAPAPTPSTESKNITPGNHPSPDSASVNYVPAHVMEGRLLSAPRPLYPHLAQVSHITGSVALQATISKTGSIETLHVIKGPQALRGAAIDAVRHWRYKPYSIDGRPVKVSTTVNVHFTMRPHPTIAH